MPEPINNGMQCGEFDLLLSDALDGALTGVRLERFQDHTRSCGACGPLFAEVEAGRNWLKELTEVEPPASLMTNILASTTGVETQRIWTNLVASRPQVTWLEKVQAWASGAMQPIWETARQPRFAMSFGMAFFALSVAMSALGVKPADLRAVSLRPTAVRHTYYNAQARVVRYYDNIRFVYEVESRVRELKRDVAPAVRPAKDATPEKKDHKDDTTQRPEQKEDRNYSQMESQFVLAKALVGSGIRNGCIGGFINDRFIGKTQIRNTQIENTQIENKKTEDLAVADLAVADLAVNDLAVKDLAVIDLAVKDLTLDDPSVVSPSTHRRLV